MQRQVVVIGGLAVALTFCRAALGDVILSLDPLSQVAGVGSSVNVGLEISGLGGFTPPALGAFDITVAFDPTILQFAMGAFGDPILGDQLNISGLGSISSVSSGPGSVELFELSLDSIDALNSLQPATFTLATLTFNTTSAGASPLNLSINALSDAYGDALSAQVQNGGIGVTAVPEPTSPLLVCTALISLLLFERFCRSRWNSAAPRGKRRDILMRLRR